MKNILLSVAVLTAGCATFALLPAQEPAAPGMKTKTKTIFTKGVPVTAAPVTGAPYSAVAITETTLVLGDGNRIVQSQSQKLYRDGQGRERTEDVSGSTAMISDPATKTSYQLNMQSRTATQMPLLNLIARNSATKATFTLTTQADLVALQGGVAILATAVNAGANSEHTIYELLRSGRGGAISSEAPVLENLPQQNMEGVLANGTRSTVTIPAGTVGNERAIQVVEEVWYSPDLKMNVKTVHNDPRSGESVYQLTQIIRAEPAPQLFQVPPDYALQGEVAGGRGRGPALVPAATAAPAVQGAVKYGGQVMMAKVISKVEPQYTDEARKAKWQGTVTLNVTVDETGKPADITVAKSLGMGLDEQAMLAVWQWRFQPTLLNNMPVKVQTQVEVPFKLQ